MTPTASPESPHPMTLTGLRSMPMKKSAVACPRCGYEIARAHWWDENPMAAVLLGALFGVPSVVFMVGAVAVYPWLLVPLVIVAAVAGLALWVEWRRRERAAIAARADYDYRSYMAAMAARPWQQ